MSHPNPALLEVGQVFNDRYEIVRCIKAGGMGAVYEVFHRQTKKKRALKVMLPQVVADEGMRSRFKVEATIVSAVESEHIAEVIDAGVDDASGSPFIVMELLKGEELGAMITRAGTLPPEDVVLYLSQAARGLERTHAQGIVHRDLKPENLFVTYGDDGSPRLKLLDFGIAKVLGDTGTQHTRGILGTPMYISAEQVHGEQAISPRTDVYALAHIAYHLLTGEPYWKPEEEEAESVMPFLVKVMKGRPEPASARAQRRRGVVLPPAFDAWFDKAAAVEPEQRHEGPGAAVTKLAAVFDLNIKSPTFSSVPSQLSSSRRSSAEPTAPIGASTFASGTASSGAAVVTAAVTAAPTAGAPSATMQSPPASPPHASSGPTPAAPKSTNIAIIVGAVALVVIALLLVLWAVEDYLDDEDEAPAPVPAPTEPKERSAPPPTDRPTVPDPLALAD